MTGTASASESDINLSVAPQSFEFKAQKGETIKDKIKLYNRGSVALPMETVADDFGAEEESGAINFGNISQFQDKDKNSVEDISKWITIENPDFILVPGGQKSVNFTISVPKNVKDGGKYAVIFFQPRLSSAPDVEKTSVRITQKIGVLFLLSVGDTAHGKAGEPVSVAEFNIPENLHLQQLEDLLLGATGLFHSASAEEKNSFTIVATSELPFTLRLKNNDIYHIKPAGKLSILSAGGALLGETEISPTTILPGKIRRIPVEFKPENFIRFQKYLPAAFLDLFAKNFIWGKYYAQLSLKAEKGTIEKEIEFWVFPWKTAAVFLFLIILIVLMRKRLAAAGRVLFVKREI